MSSSTISGPKRVSCIHCGTPFSPRDEDDKFCCGGCEFVYNLIHHENLDRYYDLKKRTAPVGGLAFRDDNAAWAVSLQQQADQTANPGGLASATLEIQGVSCAACVWLVESVFKKAPGAVEARVNSSTGRVDLRWETGRLDLPTFIRQIQRFGYRLGPVSKTPDGIEKTLHTGLGRRLGLCAAFAMNAMLFTLPHYLGIQPGDAILPVLDGVTVVLATLSLLVGGSLFIRRGFEGLVSGVIHIDLPIALGLLVAYAASVYAWIFGDRNLVYLDFVSVFTCLMLAGRWTQERAVAANRGRLLRGGFEPGTIELAQSDGSFVEAAPETIVAGLRYRLEPGRNVPVRSRLVSDSGVFSLDWISGESDPLAAGPGAVIPSGAQYLGKTPMLLEALENWDQALLPTLVGAENPPPERDIGLEKFIAAYLLIVLLLAVAAAFFWLRMGDGAAALRALVAVLVVSCPCATGVSIPLTYEMATSSARRFGFFVRESSLWRRLLAVRKVVFDKTGTLTLDRPEIAEPSVLDNLKEHEAQVLLALVEASLHPVARAVREELLRRGILPASPRPEVCELVGQGLQTKIDGLEWRFGKRGWAVPGGAGGGTILAREGSVVLEIGFVERAREGAAEECRRLRDHFRLALHVLSGDRRNKVEPLASDLGIPPENVRAEADPQAKLQFIREIDQNDTLMLGDGANDSLAFSAAWCRGTPAVDRGMLEQRADFYIMGTRLDGLSRLFSLAHARHKASVYAVGFSILYNVVMVALSAAGLVGPLVAAVVMPASSVISLAIVGAVFRSRTEAPG